MFDEIMTSVTGTLPKEKCTFSKIRKKVKNYPHSCFSNLFTHM